MTSKEFVKQKHPTADANKMQNSRLTYWVISDKGGYRLSEAKTERTAWSLAKKLIIENEQLKKHETQTT